MNDEVYKGYYEMVWWRLWRKISSFPSWRIRKKFFSLFMKTICPAENDLVLDMGITADLVHKADNYFEKLYPYSDRITAIGIENLSRLRGVYPLVKLVQADGTNLPFADKSFDIVFSGSVLEHVGSRERQRKFISEALRVGKKVFITVPDSHFPIELHSGLPLMHLFSVEFYRKILKFLKEDFFAREENLNIISKNELFELIKGLDSDLKILRVRFLFFPLTLIVVKI